MIPESETSLGVSEFVALVNQNFEHSYYGISIIGELANFRISKNRWVYFDLKDDDSTLKFFGSVYNLPGPLEEGMMLSVKGVPRLHNLYGFSVNIQKISLAGEGTIKRAAELLKKQLTKEGLFDLSRKRALPYPPNKIGLIASEQSAAFADFMKIINARWSVLEIDFIDVQVQGEPAIEHISEAVENFNKQAELTEVLVIIRGGGSAEDLAAFSSEQVTRAVAASRIPTLVAIGHEIDLSLAELAADQRASTPSNAAELLVPDKKDEIIKLSHHRQALSSSLSHQLSGAQNNIRHQSSSLAQQMEYKLDQLHSQLSAKTNLLSALSPLNILDKGYAIVYKNGSTISSISQLELNDKINITLKDGLASASIQDIKEL